MTEMERQVRPAAHLGNVGYLDCVLGAAAQHSRKEETMSPLFRLVVAALAVLLTGAGARDVYAQGYPSKPIHIIVPYPAGGGNDIVTRVVAQKLADRLSQPVVIDNKPGGSTLIGAEAAVRAPADGYTLFVGTIATMAINPNLYSDLPYNPTKDFLPIIRLVNNHMVLVANPDLPVHSVKELVAYAKANSGKISYASFGNGSTPHLGMELLKTMTGIDMVHIPYKGAAQSLTDLLGGYVSVMFIDTTPALSYIKVGKIRALAVASPKRLPQLPDVPTVGELSARLRLHLLDRPLHQRWNPARGRDQAECRADRNSKGA